jgi:hypothetical protein
LPARPSSCRHADSLCHTWPVYDRGAVQCNEPIFKPSVSFTAPKNVAECSQFVSHFAFEVLTAVMMSTLVFSVVMPCILTGTYQPFGEIYCLPLQSSTLKMELVCFPEKMTSSLPKNPCEVTTQKTNVDLSNFVWWSGRIAVGYMRCLACVDVFIWY